MPFRSLLSRVTRVLSAGVALTFAVGVAMVGCVIGAQPASAHAELVRMTPYAGARLTTAPADVVLEFNEAVNPSFATVVVTSAAGASVIRGKPRVTGATVTQALSPGLTSGRFRVAFRVVSDDGHQVTGESSFTLTLTPATGPTARTHGAGPTPRASSTPGASSPPSRASAPSASSAVVDSPGDAASTVGPIRWRLPVAGGLGVLVLGVCVLVWRRQQR